MRYVILWCIFFISVIWVYNVVVATTKEVTIKSGGVLNIHHNSSFLLFGIVTMLFTLPIYDLLTNCPPFFFCSLRHFMNWSVSSIVIFLPSFDWHKMKIWQRRCVSVCSIFHLVDDRIGTHTQKSSTKQMIGTIFNYISKEILIKVFS